MTAPTSPVETVEVADLTVSNHPDWFSQHIPVWRAILAPFIGKPRLRFLEIGSFEGRSAVWTLRNILTDLSSTLTCIDTFQSGDDYPAQGLEATFRANLMPWVEQVQFFCGPSGFVLRGRDVPPFNDSIGPRPFHFIYIDGSHVAEDVLEDAVLTWRMLAPGGIMAFDDYRWGETNPPDRRYCPRAGIDAFLATRRPCSFRMLHKDVQVFIQKAVR